MEIPLLVQAAAVAGVEPAVRVDGLVLDGDAVVACHQAVALRQDLTRLPGGAVLPRRGIGNAKGDVLQQPTDGAHDMLVRVLIVRDAHGGHLAQAVGGQKVVFRHGILKTLHLRAGCGSGGNDGAAEAREHFGAEVPVVHEGDEHGRHRMEDRAALGVDQVQDGAGADILRQVNQGVGTGAGDQARHQAEDVEHRQNEADAVLSRQALGPGAGAGGAQHAVRRQEHSLRGAGVARGEDHQRGIVRLHRLHGAGGALPDPRAKVAAAADIVKALELFAGSLTDLAEECGLLLHLQDLAAAQQLYVPAAQDLGDFLRLEAGVDERRHRAELLDGEEGIDPVDGISAADGHMAAPADAEGGEVRGDKLRAGVDLPPAMLPRLTHDGDAVSGAPALLGKEIPEGAGEGFPTPGQILRQSLPDCEEIRKAAALQGLEHPGAELLQPYRSRGKAAAGDQQLPQSGKGDVGKPLKIQGQGSCIRRDRGEGPADLPGALRVQPPGKLQAAGVGCALFRFYLHGKCSFIVVEMQDQSP